MEKVRTAGCGLLPPWTFGRDLLSAEVEDGHGTVKATAEVGFNMALATSAGVFRPPLVGWCARGNPHECMLY